MTYAIPNRKDRRWYPYTETARRYRERARNRPAFERYVMHGVPPGSFLMAALSNDLRETFARADSTNARCVRAYVQFFYSHTPAGSWGSPEKVNAWIARGGLSGRAAA